MTKIITNIEQRSDDWFDLKLGKIGGSKLHTFINPSGKLKKDKYGNLGKTSMTAIYTAIAEKLTGFSQSEDLSFHPAVQHGIAFEEEAKRKFLDHIGFAENETGAWMDCGVVQVDWLENFLLSPDFICGEDPREALEVKCPTSPRHIEIWHTKKIPDHWIPQAIGYFVFMEHLQVLNWCSYDFRVKLKPLIHIKITRKEWEERIKYATEAVIEIDEIINKLIQSVK